MTTTERCGAKAKSTGKPCQRQAGAGTDHPGVGRCSRHGGSSPQAQLSGVVELGRRRAMVMGLPAPADPAEAILEMLALARGEVIYATEQIAALHDDQAVGPVTTITRRPLKEEKGAESLDITVEEIQHGPPALHIWIRVRREAMDRVVQYSATALRAGVEERRIKLAEQQGQLLADVIRGVLADLGVDQHPDARRVVRRHLELAAVSIAA